MSGRLRAGAVIGALVLVLGALIGALVLPPLLPASSVAAEGPRSVPVSARDFDDLHTVAAVPELSDEVTVALSGAGGMVTASTCKPGHQVSMGETLLSIEGKPRIAIVTAVPLWRIMRPGVKGPDVKALQRALIDSGYDVVADGSYGAGTLSAVRKVQEVSAVEKTGVIDLDRVQWIPAGIGAVSSCEAGVGAVLSGGSPLLKAGGGLISLTLPAAATELTGRSYAATAGKSVVPLSKERKVTDPELLRAVSASAAFSEWKQDPGRGIAVQVRLVEPIAAVGVPPSAVLTMDSTHGCVVSGSQETVSVEILASELGTVYVVSEEPVDDVLMPVAEVRAACE